MSRPMIEVEGFPELIRQIQSLANDRQKRAEIIKILRRVAQGTVKAARREAPKAKRPHKARKDVLQPGTLRKSIGVIVGRNRENALVYVGPRAKGNNKGWYGHFVEYGHNIYRSGFRRRHSSSAIDRAHNASGAVGRTQGNPFMSRAYSATKGQVTDESVNSVAAYIQKRINALR